MFSIRKKIALLIVSGILSVSAALVIVAIFITNDYAAKNARITLNSTCEAKAQEINNRMKLVEQAVSNIYLLSEKERPDLENFNNQEMVENYIESFQKIAVEVASNTDGAIAVYYRVNPDILLSGKTGFFSVKSLDDGEFYYHEITDLLEYDSEDIEHVGWYYIPVRAGKPVWMEPYYNQNIGVEMISYVIPIFDGNHLIGVVGIDIDFMSIVDIADSVDIYGSGSANLIGMTNSIIYMKNKKDGKVSEMPVPEKLYNTLLEGEDSDKLAPGRSNDINYFVSHRTLSNHMKLIVYAPVSDVNRQRNMIIFRSAAVTMAVLAVILFFTIRMTSKIINPLNDITEATRKFADGNWDAELKCKTKDELQQLSDSILIMAGNTKKYINEINNMAFTDGLTGVKNKTCYMNYTSSLAERVQKNSSKYGIVVFDVNGLKAINDTEGHEAGDQLIKNACRLICQHFSHSPVFRVGGDEFVVILENDDYCNREDIITSFRKSMTDEDVSFDGNIRPSVACGMACCPADGEDFSEVFRMADERMYDNKVMMKGGAAPR